MLLLVFSASASAATLKANYQLQGSHMSGIVGAPELVDIEASNAFATESPGGIERQVLTFPKGGGLSMSTAGLVDPYSHSVAMVFRLSELSGFRRILDFSNGTLDQGLYNLDGKVALYDSGAPSQSVVFNDSYALLVLTNAIAPGGSQKTIVYVNGVEVSSAKNSEGFDLTSGVLRFFADNTSGPATGEESAGALGCVLVYDGTLTATEAGQLAAAPLCIGPPKALSLKKPKAKSVGRQMVVDTGLVIHCPAGTEPCLATGRVDAIPARQQATTRRRENLGTADLLVSPGSSVGLVVQLSRNGVRALRDSQRLLIVASGEIAGAGGRATAERMGSIKAVGPYSFKTGVYAGTTSQGLPIRVRVGPRAIRSVYLRWRGECDGRTRTHTVLLRGKSVRRGPFSFLRALELGGLARLSGRIEGAHVSGFLSHRSPSPFGGSCAVDTIRWHARARN